jgi:ribosomal protein S27AE
MTNQLKYVMTFPIATPAEVITQINDMGFQLELVRSVHEGGFKEIEFISQLRFMGNEEFATVYQSHKCVLDAEGECPVCVVRWQRMPKASLPLPSGVEAVEPDSVAKEESCPECSAPVMVHAVSGNHYCGRCDWVGEGCNHVPEDFEVSMGEHGVETFTRCAKCPKILVNGRYV